MGNRTRKPTADVTEKRFRAMILELAAACGWRAYFTHNSKHSPAGFPDLVLLRDGRLKFWELKTRTGRTTPEQDAWLADLAQTGHDARVVRPDDWEIIVLELRRRKPERGLATEPA